jgi:hypothetical protein
LPAIFPVPGADNERYLLTVNAAGGVTFNNTLAGAGGLKKVGAGTPTLYGSCEHLWRPTTVNAGTLVLDKRVGIPRCRQARSPRPLRGDSRQQPAERRYRRYRQLSHGPPRSREHYPRDEQQ